MLTLINKLNFTSWERWTLIALTYDLAGGITANFSYGTSHYYTQSRKEAMVYQSALSATTDHCL